MAYKRGSGPPVLAGNVLVDIVEGYNGFFGGASAITSTPGIEWRSFAQSNGQLALMSSIGGVMTVNYDAASGRTLLNMPSAASRVTRLGSLFRFPLSQRFRDPDSVPLSMLRPTRRYTYEHVCRITTPGTALVEMGLAVSNGGLFLLGTGPGCIWHSISSQSGGNWIPSYRLLNGGGFTTLAQSGVSAYDWHKLGWRYTEGETPRFEWLIDDNTFQTLSGDANMPVLAAIGSPFVPFNGIGTPAGSNLQLDGGRFVVEEI